MISHHSKVPFYYQLYEILRAKIASGEWKPGDRLPAESELVASYRVSRSTVRQAMDMLVSNGQIYRQRGRGSFVAHPTVEQALSRIVSFTEDMRQRGLQPHSQVLASDLVPAPEDIAAALQVRPGEELAYLERLRLADNEPMSLEQSYLVHRFCPGILDRENYAECSLRETLAAAYGLQWSYAKQTIRAISASRKIAAKLSIPPHAALLYIERTSYSSQNVPVEFIRFYHRGDRYVLYNDLRA